MISYIARGSEGSFPGFAWRFEIVRLLGFEVIMYERQDGCGVSGFRGVAVAGLFAALATSRG